MNELIDRARAMSAEIAAARPDMEAHRRLPDALARSMSDAGFYRMCVPARHGGSEVHPATLVEVIETLAATDASAAWCVMIGATTGSIAAYLDAETADEVFADPAAIICGVYAPSGQAERSGAVYRMRGRWRWNSGGRNATWLCGGCVIMENGAPRMLTDKIPDQRMMVFRASEATFIDTWRTTGLVGTGSGDFTIDDLAVPVARSVSLMTDTPRIETPLYRFPIFGLLALGIAAVASGNARAALDEFATLASGKRTPGGRSLAERGTVQAAFADASARLAAARALLMESINSSWSDAAAGRAISVASRAALRLAATHMTRTAAEVVRGMQDLAGGAGVFHGDPLLRRLNDAQTMTAHVMIAPATYELTGRALLGVPVNAAEL